MRRAACTSAALLAALALARAAAPRSAATPPACPDAVKAPSAIVIEVSTGIVACARQADKERPIGSTTKLMTALLDARGGEAQRARSRPRTTAPSPIESQIGLQPGERMKVSDLMRGLLLESGNDAAVTLAEGVSGSRKAFVREMNRRAAQARPRAHALRQPDRARPGGQLLQRARPRDARHRPAHEQRSSRRSWTRRRAR